ncbi:MAG: Gfo/Idh/MocA family oxidoreductase [Rubrivivax sp.]
MDTHTHTIGIGILGTGIMGQRMLAAMQQHLRFRVLALWDSDPAALHAAASRAEGGRMASSAEDLIADPALQVVYVASPPSNHATAVRAVLAAGKACLCEKPLTHDAAEARALCEQVRDSGLPFAVNFPFARSLAAGRMVEQVRGGHLGDIQSASITLRFAAWPRPWQAGASAWLAGATEGGFTREVLSHFVFLSQRLFGPATVAEVQLDRPAGGTEVALRARLVHEGVTVQVDAAVAGAVADQNRFEVIGTKGRVALVDWAQLEVDGQLSERVDSSARTLDGLAACLDGHGDHGLATVGEAASVVRVIEALLSS